jgi:hypothetical protein
MMLITLYSAGATATGVFWLIAFLRDRSTPKTHLMSWVVLGIATALWPITFPLSCLELFHKAQKRKQQQADEQPPDFRESFEHEPSIGSNTSFINSYQMAEAPLNAFDDIYP